MTLHSAEFVTSSDHWKKCPPESFPEYAFIGRSNVGKSSLINYLANKNKLAKTSSTPGKTQLINHFIINENWFLSDLPGYGYAKVSKKKRAEFSKLITGYLLNRPQLITTFLLVDSRHDPLQNDLDFMLWLGEKGLPFSIVFTKIDKQKKSKAEEHIQNYKNTLLEYWQELPPIFITSAEKKIGGEDIMNYIADLNEKFSESS